MFTRGKEIILAVFLGLVCPAVMVGLLPKQERVAQVTPLSSIETTEEKIPIQISVLDQNDTVLRMDLNDYLTCVVLKEMPASFEMEALKAQAVVARTYALRRIVTGGKHTDAAVCMNSDCCQGYCDIDAYLTDTGKSKDVSKVREAVEMTSDMVLVYEGQLIDATYFSCSGGKTEDAQAVWGSDIPYLQSTESPGEENAVHYADTVTFRSADFLRKLNISLENNEYIKIGEITYTTGGGVDSIRICGVDFNGTDFRKRLGLRSTVLMIHVVGDTVTITTKGYGHRVGMSQYGADAMAVGGAAFPEILAHYYQGTQLVTYQSD